jgi:hypothetical protein
MIIFVINLRHTYTHRCIISIPMPMDLTYHLNPLYVWVIFMGFNLIQPLISISIHSLDYRAALIFMNVVGLYLFLQHVRIDFTLRLTMNQ